MHALLDFRSRRVYSAVMSGLYRNKAVLALCIGVFLAVAVGGVLSSCGMDPIDHISHWQEQSLTLMSDIVVLAIAVLVALFALPPAAILSPERVSIARQRRDKRVFDPLRLALMRGVVHSKAF